MNVYCHFCDKHLDSKVDVEHWDENARCLLELDQLQEQYFKMFEPCDWEDQAHYGDAVNKQRKESPTIKRTDPDTGRDWR